MVLFFIRATSFFLICVQKIKNKKNKDKLRLYSMCGSIKTLKHNVRTTLQLACHSGCKNLRTTPSGILLPSIYF